MCGDESTEYVSAQLSDINTIRQAPLMALLFLAQLAKRFHFSSES